MSELNRCCRIRAAAPGPLSALFKAQWLGVWVLRALSTYSSQASARSFWRQALLGTLHVVCRGHWHGMQKKLVPHKQGISSGSLHSRPSVSHWTSRGGEGQLMQMHGNH